MRRHTVGRGRVYCHERAEVAASCLKPELVDQLWSDNSSRRSLPSVNTHRLNRDVPNITQSVARHKVKQLHTHREKKISWWHKTRQRTNISILLSFIWPTGLCKNGFIRNQCDYHKALACLVNNPWYATSLVTLERHFNHSVNVHRHIHNLRQPQSPEVTQLCPGHHRGGADVLHDNSWQHWAGNASSLEFCCLKGKPGLDKRRCYREEMLLSRSVTGGRS